LRARRLPERSKLGDTGQPRAPARHRTHDLIGLGALANHVREERHGDAAYFVWNTHSGSTWRRASG
jgi:hypothetical protein